MLMLIACYLVAVDLVVIVALFAARSTREPPSCPSEAVCGA